MEMIENKNTGKRRMPHMGKIVLAAALAVGCVLSIAAGLPAQVYHFIGGGSVTVDPNTNTAYYDRSDVTAPVEVDENGRVWLTADGQHLDITDKVDENTPYLYECADEATGQKGYLVIGGEHDDLGWMEWYQIDGDWFWHAENCLNAAGGFSVGAAGDVGDVSIVVNLPDGIMPDLNSLEPAPSGDVGYDAEENVPYSIDFRPWVEAGIAQLAEMGVVACEPQVD